MVIHFGIEANRLTHSVSSNRIGGKNAFWGLLAKSVPNLFLMCSFSVPCEKQQPATTCNNIIGAMCGLGMRKPQAIVGLTWGF